MFLYVLILCVLWVAEIKYVYMHVYTVRQKKGIDFLLCAYFCNTTETGEFFTYIKGSICYNSVYLILACVKNFA